MSESSLHAKVDLLTVMLGESREDARTLAEHMRDHAEAVHRDVSGIRSDLATAKGRIDAHSDTFRELTTGIGRLSVIVSGLEHIEQSRAERMRVARSLMSWGAAALGVLSTGAGVLAAMGLR